MRKYSCWIFLFDSGESSSISGNLTNSVPHSLRQKFALAVAKFFLLIKRQHLWTDSLNHTYLSNSRCPCLIDWNWLTETCWLKLADGNRLNYTTWLKLSDWELSCWPLFDSDRHWQKLSDWNWLTQNDWLILIDCNWLTLSQENNGLKLSD